MIRRGVKTTTIIGISIFGLLMALISSLLISKKVASAVSDEVQDRIVDIIFDSVAAGPLAFARLQSSAIANEQLQRLMKTEGLKERGIQAVEILSGEADQFRYASWQASERPNPSCLVSKLRNFEFADALHPFVVKIEMDTCATLQEKSRIQKFSVAASSLILLVAALILFASFWPMISSVARADALLVNNTQGDLSGIWLESIRRLVQKAIRVAELEKKSAIAEVAAQVSHDIRSPVTVLNMIVKTLTEVPEDKRKLIESVAERINQIANDLLKYDERRDLMQAAALEKSADEAPLISELLDPAELVETILSEKKLFYANRPDLKIESDFKGDTEIWAMASRSDLERIISNLINNAAEAVEGAGTITVSVRTTKETVSIIVSDTGKGIPQEVLARIGERGFTFGKAGSQSGSGLGIYHAKSSLEKWGGKFSLASKENTGTMATMTLARIRRATQTTKSFESRA